MKLKAFLQLQKSEIQSLSHTDNLSNIETLNLLGTDTIIAGTGTTGDTTILHSYTSTIAGITMDSGITIGIIIFISLVLGQLIDRRVNRDLYQHQDQDQDNQEL